MLLKSLLEKKENDWMLQSIIDTLAVSQSLPIRLLHLDELNNLYQHFSNVNEPDTVTDFQNRFPKKDDFNDLCRRLVDWADKGFDCSENDYKETLNDLSCTYDSFSHKIFPILPANLHSLEFLNQTVLNTWRIFSVLNIYYHFCLSDSAPTHSNLNCIEDIYGLDSFNIYHTIVTDYRISNPENKKKQLILLAGPVFLQEQENLLDESSLEESVYDKISEKLQDFAKSQDSTVHVRESYFRQAAHRDTIYCKEYIEDHVNIIIKSWHSLLEAEIINQQRLSPKILKLLGLWGVLNINLQKEGKLADQVFEFSNDESCTKKNCQIQFSLHKKPNKANSLHLVADLNLQDEAPEDNNNFTDYIGGRFLRLHRAFERKYKQLNSNRLLILELWLNGIFSGLVADKVDNIREQLAAWICAVMRADIAEIIDYHPETPEQLLQKISVYPRSTHQFPVNKFKEKLKLLPKEKYSNSSIYQSLTTGDSTLCFSRDCNNCTILTYKDIGLLNTPTEESELVVPIKFNSRVIGVVEVASFTPWRLSISHQTLLFSIVTQFGAFWHQARYFGALKNIQTSILNFYSSNANADAGQDLYHHICEQSAMLYLSLGAGLWIKDSMTQDYHRKGFHHVDIDTYIINPNNGSSTIANIIKKTKEAIKKGQQFPHFNEEVDKCLYMNADNKRKFKEKGIKYIHYIPIINHIKGSNIIAILSIYDNTDRGFDDSWKYISQFYSDYLGIIIDSIQAHIQSQKTNIALFEHELRDAVSHLTRKARKTLNKPRDAVQTLSRLTENLGSKQFEQYIFKAKLFNDLPDSFDIKNLNATLHQLKSYIELPANDIHHLASILEHKISVIDPKNLEVYKEEHRNEIRHLIAVTDDKRFVDFITKENILGIKEETLNLKELFNQNECNNKINNSINIKIKKQALEHVIRNLYRNAQKYRLKPSDTIEIESTITRKRGLLITISNISKEYTDEELNQLQEPGFRAGKVLYRMQGSSLNEGLGLYLVRNLCKHILSISFKIKQEKHGNNYWFTTELRFSPAKLIR